MFWIILVGQLIGTLTGCVIGAYITGRWTEAGRINAVTAALAKVVKQETAKAFAQEQGKQAALMDNLQHLDIQMRTLTTTQEEIKARISNEVWDRQWRLSQKRDLYTKLLDVTERLAHLYMEIQFGAMDEAEEKIARQKMLEASLELRRLGALAKIFGNEDCYKALKEFFSATTSQEPTKNWAEKAEEKANTLSGKLIRAAKREFGLES